MQKLLYFRQKEDGYRVLGVYKIFGRGEGAGLRLGLQERLQEYHRTGQPARCHLGHSQKGIVVGRIAHQIPGTCGNFIWQRETL